MRNQELLDDTKLTAALPLADEDEAPPMAEQPGLPIVVRQSTRAAFEALRTAGAVPSVRKLHAQLGGSYNRLVEEVRALRAELAAGLPTVLPALPDERAPVREERDGVLLTVTPRTADALEQTRQALREDTRLYHDVVLFLRKLQRTNEGPLTEALAAWVGQEA